MTTSRIILAISAMIFLAIVGMAVQYLIYRQKVGRGRAWHPERKVRKPFWL
jgi:hypothetical protein